MAKKEKAGKKARDESAPHAEVDAVKAAPPEYDLVCLLRDSYPDMMPSGARPERLSSSIWWFSGSRGQST